MAFITYIYLKINILNDDTFVFLYCNIFLFTIHPLCWLLHVQRPNLTNVRLQVYIVSITVNINEITQTYLCKNNSNKTIRSVSILSG